MTKAQSGWHAAAIFQMFWHIVGDSITKAATQVLRSGQFLLSLNHTFITLILKQYEVIKVSDFKPISLCNVLYKVIAKVIANRLKVILSNLILDSQSAFVLERQILDNVLIAYELLHFLRRKKMGKQRYISIKLDMSKAYDRVEWNYLNVRFVMGFKPSFIQLIMGCVSLASFPVLVNGSPKGHIIPTRGQRQGDPLFPYLFFLCNEGLISLLTNLSQKLLIQRIKVCKWGPLQLIITDDSVLFCKANVRTKLKIQQLLKVYELAFRQHINTTKTVIVFSKNTLNDIYKELMALSTNGTLQQYEKNLGLPPMIGKSKRKAFAKIKDWFWHKLQSWIEKKIYSKGEMKFF